MALEDQIEQVRAFNRFYTAFLGLLNERLLGSAITLTEGRVIFEVHACPGIRARELMDILGLDRGYLSRLLGRLEKKGHIQRQPDPEDRRARRVRLTSRGEHMLLEVMNKASLQIRAILLPLSDAERRRLVAAMATIRQILEPEQV